jgi:coenzyme F420-dependent glucose-6-phosphate dehydrogenase
MTLKFGYKASAEQFGPRDLLDFAIAAEEAGFDSVFVSDHFQPWRHTGGHAPFSFAWMGALGALTSHIAIGTSVLTPTFRYHPSVVAHAFGTLGALFPGRVILGVGTGEALNETPSTGMEWPDPKERLARLREAIELIKRLWTEDRVTFDGKYYKVRNATIYDRPETPVPIYIAGAGPLITKYAGRTADGFICTSGREPSAVDLMIEMKVSFDTDRDRALQDTRAWAALALTAEEKVTVEDPLDMEKLADALPTERAASRWIVSTDPEEQVERIRPYVEMGFRHLVFHAPGADQRRFLKLYSEKVLPRLRVAFP